MDPDRPDTPAPPPAAPPHRPPPTAAGPPPEAVRPTVTVSLMAGLCPLIPLPFVDDWVERVVRRRAVRDLLRERGIDPTPGEVDVLAGLEDRGDDRGCLLKALLWGTVKMGFYLVRKVFRKIVFILAINDAANAASATFHDLWLLRLALDRGALTPGPGGRIDRERARRVRAAAEEAVRGGDARPLERAVRRVLAGSGALLRGAARQLGRWARGERHQAGSGADGEERAAQDLPVKAEERRLAGVVDKLVDAVWLERGYLAALERRFGDRLEARRESPGGPPPPAAS